VEFVEQIVQGEGSEGRGESFGALLLKEEGLLRLQEQIQGLLSEPCQGHSTPAVGAGA